jgi:RNA polymerase sigma-70 factor, ECF subfamily
MTDAYLPGVAAGDRAAMRRCIDRYSDLVWSLALRLSPSRSDAEDAVQDVFVSLWQNAAKFDPTKGSEPTFVAVIARRRLIDRLRRAGTGTKAGRDAPDFDLETLAAPDDVHATAEGRIAARALNELPEARREVVALSCPRRAARSSR